MISSIVLFFSRAICGSGPKFEFPAPEVAIGAGVADAAGAFDPVGAFEDDGAAPNRLDVGAAAEDDGGGAVDVVAVLPPPNRPPRDGAAGVDVDGALVVLFNPPNKPPADGAAELVGVEPKSDDVVPVGAVDTAGVGGLLAPKLKALAAGALPEPKRPPLEVGGALEVGAEPNNPADGGAEVVFVEGAAPKRLLAAGADVVVAAGLDPKRLVVGAEDVVAAELVLNRLLVGGALAAGVPPNKPPADGAELAAGAPPNRPPADGVELI